MIRIFTLALVFAAGLAGTSRSAEPELSALAGSRTHAIMRHALAPGFSDPANFDVNDCATQRNLNEVGREQARETGAAFRAAGAGFDAVWTSQWCRCVDTAALLDLGVPVEVPALNSFFEDRSTRGAQTEAVQAKLLALPPDTTVMMVTHQVNISALIGRSTTSGEVVVFSIGEDGQITIRGSFVMPTR